MASLPEQLLARHGRTGIAPPDDEAVQAGQPFLWQLLTQDRYSDGTIRELPSIRVERASGGYAVTLQDHASNQQCSCWVGTLGELAEGLEAILGDLQAWRPFQSFKVRDPDKRRKAKGDA